MQFGDLPIRRRTSLTPPPDQRGGRARLLALMLGVVLASGFLMFRLYGLQITRGAEFKKAANQTSQIEVRTPALRGLIYDRDGVPLVLNAPAYQITITPIEQPSYTNTVQQRMDRVEIYNHLAQLINQPELTAGDIMTKVTNPNARAEPYKPVVIADNVPRDIALRIQEEALQMPGVGVQNSPSRVYPYKELLGNLLGYTAKIPNLTGVLTDTLGDIQKEWLNRDIYSPDDRVGVSGIEYVEEPELRGVKGRETERRDASGEILGTVGDPIPPKDGYGVKLTLDLRLQKIISDAMMPVMAERKSPRGAAVVMNPNTGEVLGMFGTPGYDNNLFVNGISADQFNAYSSNLHLPLLNHATRDLVPPGSTFKIVTAAALLEEKAVTPNTIINDPGVFVLPNQFFPDDPSKGTKMFCWIGLTGGSHGPQRVTDALRNSCNTYFRKAVGGFEQEGIDGMGPDKLSKWAELFGVGDEKNQIETGGSTGLAPTPAWKRKTLGQVWTTGDSYNYSIGQGYLLVTPLEMANIISVIANGGTLYQPRIVGDIVDAQGKVVRKFQPKVLRKVPVSPTNMKLIQDALVSVVGPNGTAVASQIPDFQFAGKTGTAEFCDDIALKTGVCYIGMKTQPTHAWFVAYAPADKPQIAIAVYVWNGGQGSGVAAPIAQRIIADYFKIPLDKKAPVQITE